MNELLRELIDLGEREERVLLLGHPHADPDAVGSVIALKELLESLGAKAECGVPGNLSRLSKSVLGKMGIGIDTNPPVNADYVIILDTSSLDQLEGYREKIEKSNPKIIFIDHHHPDEETQKETELYFVDENASSTAELILQIGEELDYTFDDKTALLLLIGIVTDTGHLKFANKETFKAVYNLLDTGIEYKKALEIVKTPKDPSKRVAMLKAMVRSELYKSHNRWIVFSEIGAYESDAASLFVNIGADVAAVASENNDEIRISSRAGSNVVSETKLHLGKLMNDLADKFNGSGGGHSGAAAISLRGDFGKIKREIIRGLKERVAPV